MKSRKSSVLIGVWLAGVFLLDACSFSVKVLPTATSIPVFQTDTPVLPTETFTVTAPPPVVASATPTLIPIRPDTISMLKVFETFQLPDIAHGLAFTPDGAILAAAGGNADDFSIHLWDVVNGQALGQLDGHQGIIWSVAFSPNAALLASVSNDNTTKVWDWRTKTLIKSLDFPGPLTSVSFSPDGQTLAIGGVDEPQNQIQNATIWTYAVDTWQPVHKFNEYLNITALAFSPDGKWLVGGGTSRNVEVWRTSGGPAPRILNHAHQVFKAAISPDSSTVATGTCANTVNDWCTEGSTWVWDLRTGRLNNKLAGFPDVVEQVAFAADGSALVAASRDGTIRFYGTPAYQVLFDLTAPGGITALALSPEGGLLAVGGANRQIQIWKVVYVP